MVDIDSQLNFFMLRENGLHENNKLITLALKLKVILFC